eukprot:TRINITY_DN22_c1_g1_i1.p1 TRINITY_DN22_c1_g1~~TRINITY_DN22_c1_g1_i1.p1  ORF type:complete len:382 (+),score=90.16 TRINITY_DN22_c1_g1_i1:35-1147(+)
MKAALLLTVAAVCQGCTLVSMQPSAQMDNVVGRTMELGLSPKFIAWNMTRFPRGMMLGREPTISSKLMCNTSMVWEVKHAFVGLASGGASLGFVADGMNEKGLTISSLTLRVSKYPRAWPPSSKPPLCYPMLLPWLLSTASSVREAKRLMHTIHLTPALDWVSSLDFMNFHWQMTDASGDKWILEYIAGEPRWYKDEIGVLTNDPPYPWHVDNLNNYIGVSSTLNDPANIAIKTEKGPVPAIGSYGTNLLGLPGDMSPPSRFVKMFYLRQFALTAAPTAPTNLNQTYEAVTALLNSIFIVMGTVQKTSDETYPEMTHWAVMKNPAKKHLYLRSYGNMQWQKIDVAQMDKHEYVTATVENGFGGVKDITNA